MKIEKSLLSGNTPMLILSLLKSEDMYGYQMVEELAKRSDDTFLLKEGIPPPERFAIFQTRNRSPRNCGIILKIGTTALSLQGFPMRRRLRRRSMPWAALRRSRRNWLRCIVHTGAGSTVSPSFYLSFLCFFRCSPS